MAAEKSFEERLKKHIRKNGGWVTKLHADAMQGRDTLDLLGGYKKMPFYVDAKAPSGIAGNRMQRFLMKRAQKSGYVVGFVSTIDEFEALFDEPKVQGRGPGRPRKNPVRTAE